MHARMYGCAYAALKDNSRDRGEKSKKEEKKEGDGQKSSGMTKNAAPNSESAHSRLSCVLVFFWQKINCAFQEAVFTG